MIWNVFMHDFNSGQITLFNIFDHSRFTESVKELKRKKLSEEEFADRLKREVMYYFWSKYEYETVVTTFPPRITNGELEKAIAERDRRLKEYGQCRSSIQITPEDYIKIDIYDQVRLNWEVFVDYVRGAK